jgi:excisionase family DNA binding protein
MEKIFLTISEVSNYLSIKPSTLYAWVKTGEIPYYRLGKMVRFKKEDIDAWMESHRENGVDVDKKARKILKVIKRPGMDVECLVKKSIDEAKGLKYNLPSGNQVESSTRKGGDHGLV